MGWVEEYLRRQAYMARVVFNEPKLCQVCFNTGYQFTLHQNKNAPDLVCPFCVAQPYSPPALGEHRPDLSTKWHQ